MPLLELQNISMTFDKRTLYKGVNWQLHAGKTHALLGENGVGKTTLVRIILGRLRPSGGQVLWPQGQPRYAYVPQGRTSATQFGLSIRAFVALSFDSGWRPWLTAAEKQALDEVLAACVLSSIADNRIAAASGGERQRAYLAQALLRQPQLLILDEATASMDPVSKEQMMQVIQTYQRQHQASVLMISHDIPLVREYADDYLLLTADGGTAAPITTLTNATIGGGDHVAV